MVAHQPVDQGAGRGEVGFTASFDTVCLATVQQIPHRLSPVRNDKHQETLAGGFMCPACIASATVVVGSVVSSGGLTALVVKVLRKKKGEKSDSKEKE